MAGRKFMRAPALCSMAAATNLAAPKLSVIAFKVHAKVRIKMAGTMALNPSGRHSIHSLKESTLLIK